jgi:hypothetical protein
VPYIYKHITGTGVSTISISGYGILWGVVLNQLSTVSGTASTGQITVYDATTTAASTSPTVIGILNPASSGVADWIYDVEYVNGLTIQVGSAVAPLDFTVIYR